MHRIASVTDTIAVVGSPVPISSPSPRLSRQVMTTIVNQMERCSRNSFQAKVSIMGRLLSRLGDVAHEIRESKSEIRSTKSETNPKHPNPKSKTERCVLDLGVSDSGFVSDFEIRISDFEFREHATPHSFLPNSAQYI